MFQTNIAEGISIDHDETCSVKPCLGSAPPGFGSGCPVVVDARCDDSRIATGGVGLVLRQASGGSRQDDVDDLALVMIYSMAVGFHSNNLCRRTIFG